MSRMEISDAQSRVGTALNGAGTVRKVKMFGGLGFMLNDHMIAAVSRRGMLVRVGPDRQTEALKRAGVRPMVMKGRTIAGYVYVDAVALNARTLNALMRLALPFVAALPPKRAAVRPKRSSAAAPRSRRPLR